MQKLTLVGAVVLFILSTTCCFAGSEIPSLMGTWQVKSEGGVLVKGDKLGKATHWEQKQTSLSAEANISKQDGRVVFGTFKSNKACEQFMGVIGHDNKSLYLIDEDGYVDGKIINPDTIEVIYRHTTPTDSVAAVGVWTRKK